VSLAVTAYGRQAGVGPACCADGRRRARRARSGIPAHTSFTVPYFDRLKLQNFELKFKFAKYESCRPVTLSNFRKGRPVKFSTDLGINILKVTDLHGLVKLFNRTLTGFLRIQTSEFEMPTME
jgi:hypothetical protein